LCDLTGHTDKRIRKRQSLFLYEIKRDLKDPFYFDSLYFDLTGKNTKNRPSHEKKKSGKYLNVECPLYIDE
jgi:hypothetical protein